jgi:hypothetical protein
LRHGHLRTRHPAKSTRTSLARCSLTLWKKRTTALSVGWECPFGGLGMPFRWAGSALSVGWECPFGGLGVPFRWAGSALSVGWECPFGGLGVPFRRDREVTWGPADPRLRGLPEVWHGWMHCLALQPDYRQSSESVLSGFLADSQADLSVLGCPGNTHLPYAEFQRVPPLAIFYQLRE